MRYMDKDEIVKDYAGFLAIAQKEDVIHLVEGKPACITKAIVEAPNALQDMLNFVQTLPLKPPSYDVEAFIRQERDQWD